MRHDGSWRRSPATESPATTRLPSATHDDETWAEIVAVIHGQLLWNAFQRAVSDGAVLVSDRQREVVEEASTHSVIRDLRMEALLVSTASRFDAAGIPYRVLKGASIANRFYEDPVLRSFGDVDFLIRGDAVDDAVSIHPGERGPAALCRGEAGRSTVLEGRELPGRRSLLRGPPPDVRLRAIRISGRSRRHLRPRGRGRGGGADGSLPSASRHIPERLLPLRTR